MRNTFRLLQKEESYFKRGRNFRRKKKFQFQDFITQHTPVARRLFVYSPNSFLIRSLNDYFIFRHLCLWLSFSVGLSLHQTDVHLLSSHICSDQHRSRVSFVIYENSDSMPKDFFLSVLLYVSFFLLSSVLTITEYLHLYHGL